MTGHPCKNHPSFLPTTFWDQTIVIDITLVIFTHISWLTSKDFFALIFFLAETQMSQYWDWDYFFGAMDSSGSSGSAGSAAEEMVHGAFLWEKVSGKTKAPCSLKHQRGGGFKYFFSSLPGEILEFDDHIFPMG